MRWRNSILIEKMAHKLKSVGVKTNTFNEAQIISKYNELQERGVFDRYYSCDTKTVYETMVIATKAAYRQDQISNSACKAKVKKGMFYVPYKCRYCYGYHVGRMTSKKNYDF
jgi:hypothetical protein